MLQAEKNKKRIDGFFSGSKSLRIGNKSKTSEHVAQFAAVANDNIFGCATSGRYIQTTGPSVSPKQAMKKTRPVSIKISESLKKPMATMRLPSAVVSAPSSNNIFLPTLVKMNAATIAPTN